MITRSITTRFDQAKNDRQQPKTSKFQSKAPGSSFLSLNKPITEIKEQSNVSSQKNDPSDIKVSENSSIILQSESHSSKESLTSVAKEIGYKPGKLPFGRHPVTTNRLVEKIKQVRILQRVSEKIQDFILRPENSWVERLDSH